MSTMNSVYPSNWIDVEYLFVGNTERQTSVIPVAGGLLVRYRALVRDPRCLDEITSVETSMVFIPRASINEFKIYDKEL
jgi:hypothetical protein